MSRLSAAPALPYVPTKMSHRREDVVLRHVLKPEIRNAKHELPVGMTLLSSQLKPLKVDPLVKDLIDKAITQSMKQHYGSSARWWLLTPARGQNSRCYISIFSTR
jgi:hypothetical protein